MSPWKLSPDEPTETLKITLPRSMKEWLDKQGNVSKFIRKLVAPKMRADARSRDRDENLVL